MDAIVINGYVRLILSVVVAIVLLWILLKFNSRRNPQKGSLEILEERYLNGEISKEAYEEARRRQGKD